MFYYHRIGNLRQMCGRVRAIDFDEPMRLSELVNDAFIKHEGDAEERVDGRHDAMTTA